MDNKDQLNQIPGEENIINQDEKTSQTENQKVEASQQLDENQQEIEKKSESDNVLALVDDEMPEESMPEAQSDEGINQAIVEETEPVSETEIEDAPEAIFDEEPPSLINDDKVEEADQPETLVDVEPALENIVAETVELPEVPVEEPQVAEKTEEQAEKETIEAVVTPDLDVEKTDNTIEDEEDDEEEIEHEEQAIDYEVLSREELVEKLEELVAYDDVNVIKSKIALIKVNYLKKTKAEKEALIDETLSKEKEEDKQDNENTTAPEDVLATKFNDLFDIYKQKRFVFLENFEKEKLENLRKKQEILEDLKNLIGSEETLKKTYDDFKELQESWKSIGMVPKAEVNNLWQNYHFLVEKFFDKVKINKELKDLDLKKNLEQKIELCEKAEELLLETSIIRSFKELQRYHEQWKEVGPVASDKNEDLWERFKSTTDKINQRRRDYYKKLEDEHNRNLEAKAALCEKAEQLLALEVNSIREWQNKTRQFDELFKIWKTIGPAAKKQNDEIWEKFKTTLDAFFNEKKDYFAKLKDQQINNYNVKLDLCVRAEAIKESTDWRQTSRDLINLQKEWKSVGPVPRKHADKIWKRFREACDEFFNSKSNHFAHIREDETENLNKKEALIKLVEETDFGADRSENLNKLKEFQRQWTEIGFVPFKEKDRLQNAFRSAVNKQLDKLNINSSEISIESYKSKMEVLKGSPEGNKSLSRERIFIQGKITKLRDDINIWENNIGFLADTKKASLFKNEFEKKIVKAKNELEVLESKLKFLFD